MISANIIADSEYQGKRLTTLECVFPRFILPQVNTHRVFSRNTASSRAIPLAVTIRNVKTNPVIPIWSRNKSGMQGDMDVTPEEASEWNTIWLEARDDAVRHAERLKVRGAHKQAANRLLEPFMLTKSLISSTEWINFFDLRIHEDAQPEIQQLAIAMQEALNVGEPETLKPGEWHLPYILEEERSLPLHDQIKISVARCARVSYKTFNSDSNSDIENDVKLYDKLLTGDHFSPFEHIATPLDFTTLSGNFKGFKQYRKTIESYQECFYS